MLSAVHFRKPSLSPAQSVRFGLSWSVWKKSPPLTAEESLRQALTQLKEAGERLSLSSTRKANEEVALVEMRCEDVIGAARRWVNKNLTLGDWSKPVHEALQSAKLQKGLFLSRGAREHDLAMLDKLEGTRGREERIRLLGRVRNSLANTLARNLIAQQNWEAGDIPEAFQKAVMEDIKANEAVSGQLRQAFEGSQERL